MDDTLRNGILSIISNYSKLTGLQCIFCPIYTLDKLDEEVSSNCSLCRLIQTSENGKIACVNQRKAAVNKSFDEYNYQIITCHAGLFEWIAPTFYKGRPVGYFVSGFVYTDDINITNAKKMQCSWVNRFHLDANKIEEALTTQMISTKDDIVPLAELLFSLAKLNIPPGRCADKKAVDIASTARAQFIMNESEKEANIPTSKPLSFFLYQNDLDSKQLETFWKGIEGKAANIFINLMAGRYDESYAGFDEIMQMAYRENDIVWVQTGVEMLFHIIYLKFYNKDLYDTRFYRLTFDTINGLSTAKNITDIKCIMDIAFGRIYQFYNVDYGNSGVKTVSPSIVKYLEENYARDIKLQDIENLVYMSPAYASRLFKKETSFSIQSCLVNIRMKHAQDLLVSTDMPIKDIAMAVGYSDMRGFYKMFNKYFGMTCSEMRENSKTENKSYTP